MSPVRRPADIDALPIPDPETDLRYVMDAVRTIRRELRGRAQGAPLGPVILKGKGAIEVWRCDGLDPAP